MPRRRSGPPGSVAGSPSARRLGHTARVPDPSIAELHPSADEIEAFVDATPDIDRWCSGPDWILPAHRAFAPEAVPLTIGDGTGLALLGRYRTAEGATLIAGLEPLWGFACPLLGADQAATARLVAEGLQGDPTWSALAIPGLPPRRERIMPIAAELARLGDVGLQAGIGRRVIDLSSGARAWLDRRSAKFRRNLGNAQRRGAAAGVRFEIADDRRDLFARMLAVEQSSWKGQRDEGITAAEMGAFYRTMIDRLQGSGRCRAVLASIGGTDVGYVLGGVRSGRYRGLQISYARPVAELSLGHLLQSHEIRRLSEEGVASYDLGMDMPYKERMADALVDSVMLVVRRPTGVADPPVVTRPDPH